MRAIAYRAPLLDRIAGLRYAAIVAGCAIAVYLGTEAVRGRLEREHHRQTICAARLEALLARNLFVERYVRPADPCLALEVTQR